MSRIEKLAVGFGKGSARVEIITSAILALVTFFYAYTVSSFLKLEVFVIKDRVVYDNPFERYVIGNYVDHIIISVALLIWLCISLRRTKIRKIACILYGGLLIVGIASRTSSHRDYQPNHFSRRSSAYSLREAYAIKSKKGTRYCELIVILGIFFIDIYCCVNVIDYGISSTTHFL